MRAGSPSLKPTSNPRPTSLPSVTRQPHSHSLEIFMMEQASVVQCLLTMMTFLKWTLAVPEAQPVATGGTSQSAEDRVGSEQICMQCPGEWGCSMGILVLKQPCGTFRCSSCSDGDHGLVDTSSPGKVWGQMILRILIPWPQMLPRSANLWDEDSHSFRLFLSGVSMAVLKVFL